MTKNEEKINELLKQIEELKKEEKEIDLLEEYVGEVGLLRPFAPMLYPDGLPIKNRYTATDSGNSKLTYVVDTDPYFPMWILNIYLDQNEVGKFKISKKNMSFKYFCEYVIEPIVEGIVFDKANKDC